MNNQPGVGFFLDVPLSGSERFLSLVGSDGGNGYSNDQVIFGDPELELGRNLALGKPATATASYGGFPPSNVTDGELNDYYGADRSFWLGPNGGLESITVDLDDLFSIDRIDLQNTHNGGYNDRGTEDFSIWVSEDGIEWTQILDRTLPNAYGTGNVIPLASYLFDPISARYVRLDVESFYGAGAGLNEIRVYEHIPEPGTLLLLGGGLLALARRRRRRAWLS